MLLVEEKHIGTSRTTYAESICCTWSQINPMIMVGEADWHAIMSRIRGTTKVTIVVGGARVGGVRVVLEANKEKPQTTSIVVRKARKKASVGERRWIWTKLNIKRADFKRQPRSHDVEGIGKAEMG